MTQNISIRRATSGDLKFISHVLVDTWRSTFNDLLPRNFLNSLSYDKQTDRHRRLFNKSDVAYWVACQPQNEIVGFICGGPTRGSYYPFENEIYAIYVRDLAQGKGIGKRLFHAFSSFAIASGRRGIVVWVLACNPNRAFYERLGGKEVAQESITLGSMVTQQIAFGWQDFPA